MLVWDSIKAVKLITAHNTRLDHCLATQEKGIQLEIFNWLINYISQQHNLTLLHYISLAQSVSVLKENWTLSLSLLYVWLRYQRSVAARYILKWVNNKKPYTFFVLWIPSWTFFNSPFRSFWDYFKTFLRLYRYYLKATSNFKATSRLLQIDIVKSFLPSSASSQFQFQLRLS